MRGVRYPVDSLLELLALEMTHEEILSDYPDLEYDDLLAVLQYASRLTQVKGIYKVA